MSYTDVFTRLFEIMLSKMTIYDIETVRIREDYCGQIIFVFAGIPREVCVALCCCPSDGTKIAMKITDKEFWVQFCRPNMQSDYDECEQAWNVVAKLSVDATRFIARCCEFTSTKPDLSYEFALILSKWTAIPNLHQLHARQCTGKLRS